MGEIEEMDTGTDKGENGDVRERCGTHKDLAQRTLTGNVGGSGFRGRLPMGELHRSVVTVGALSLFGGGILYLKDDPEEPAARKLIYQEALEEETYEEKAMKKRFEEWMIKYDRKYRDNEEKAMRYKIFKRTAQRVDELNLRPGALSTVGTNDFADRTAEERPSGASRTRGNYQF
ncbi:uncharacterized protein LOC124694359 [Lolium rigidum]|uniref:uncharacterized protein LOC124694359 n=1 Tax=Lolium rigidum TaxID=89674 RepID=UPI001F5C1822|nr:uncharacterized protein LOC124694359 [Lolium rigidum]